MRNSKAAGKAFHRLGAEKKKGLMALCLIAVMAFMWVRVLTRKTPQAAEGALKTQLEGGDTSGSNLKITFVELPRVKGRNDVLGRDFFVCDRWGDFIRDGEGRNLVGNEEVKVVSKDGNEEYLKKVVDRLKLQAIELGNAPRAFINDKLRSIGDTIVVNDGVNMYDCKVIGVEENRVFIRCGEAEITLKLSRATEAGD